MTTRGAVNRSVTGTDSEVVWRGVDRIHRAAGEVGDAIRVQRSQQIQRRGVTVDRTERCAGDLVAEAGDHGAHFGPVEHACANVATFVVHAVQEGGAVFQFLVTEAEHEAAGLAECDVDAGILSQRGGEGGPQFRGVAGPVGVGRVAGALALHPDEAEMPRAARKAMSPSSSRTTDAPACAAPQAMAPPTRPPPMTIRSWEGIFGCLPVGLVPGLASGNVLPRRTCTATVAMEDGGRRRRYDWPVPRRPFHDGLHRHSHAITRSHSDGAGFASGTAPPRVMVTSESADPTGRPI